MSTMNYEQWYKDLNREYHEQRDRLIEVEGLLRSLVYLIEIAPDMTDADAQRIWKSQMQQTGARARELLNIQFQTVNAE